ncbi:MAG: NAD+ synthase [Chloroflexi bacterium]|nr:NAD+ synthase [Chloroflexota bacterium]
MRITLAQLNPVVGDIDGNVRRLAETLERARRDRPDLVVFPELYLVGYPPRDLLERGWFIERTAAAVGRICEISRAHPGVAILFGAPVASDSLRGKGLYNAALLVQDGHVVATHRKMLLPTYDVFDESRYFDPGPSAKVTRLKDGVLGIHVCEDAWTDAALWSARDLYSVDPVALQAALGATVLVNISASPYNVGKEAVRYELMSQHARAHGAPFVYVNQVGANDELIFDGRSMALDASGRPLAVLPGFEEAVVTVDLAEATPAGAYTCLDEIASVHDALVLGIRDYAAKCGFTRAVVSLSGGIDSSLTLYLACEALGADNMLGIAMPSPYSSPGSISDARDLAANLGAEFRIMPITGIFDAYLESLAPHFAGTAPNVAEENVQARIRGNLLMAISNKFGHLVLSCGNKSELAVGYCTLYGDMSGGLAAISDVPKTMVYDLARYANRTREIIPRGSLEKAPSAELRPNQRDQDTLPPYPVLDAILEMYVEDGLSIDQIAQAGHDREVVVWVAKKVDQSEYKRRQAAPGLRVTTKAFGSGRRIPIAAVKTP